MAPDWGFVQVITALAVLPLVLPGYWWRNIAAGSRWVWLTIQKKDGECDYLEWGTMALNPNLSVHICNGGTGVFRWCRDHPRHEPGERCWSAVLDRYFNSTKQRRTVKKPASFPLRQPFLCVDMKVIHAFILMSLEPEGSSRTTFAPVPLPPHHFELGNLVIAAERHEESGEVVVHLIPHGFVDNHLDLTPHEIECLLAGYPPYYREYLECYGHRVPSPIRSDADVYRGGWVVGVGLSASNYPLPLYFDTFRFRETYEWRGNMFWRALTRVRDVVENNIKPLYLDDPVAARNVQATIAGLNYLIFQCTDSGVSGSLRNSDMVDYRTRLGELTMEQCVTAMRIFNDSPNLDDEGLERLKEELTPMLFEVLKAVLRGAVSCMGYIKNSDREMERKMPMILSQAERVFVRGCDGSS
ncbi:hypothetical protein GALMADRAFT_240585 [Galerina marginata CBS 339.88]|uniref:Uncharacterized protein n=1 Tax=Galerina marginata (strain CBS 339.88) TaxID=685588 RepID=A0A067TQA6_GALM3|nr:hypothetical protein GALMADRAFT_240585 [Galerina marginata CBS 339.88]